MNNASTITMTAGLTSNVNIQLAFELLSVLYPKNSDGTNFIHPKNTRNKIPFFGIENAIVCVKYKGKIRGIRQNEGQMNNVVSIDLQTYSKNVNIKLAKSKVQLTGASSDTMGKRSFEILCEHINMIQEKLTHIRFLNEELRQTTIKWVIEQTNQETLKSIDMGLISSTEHIDKIFAAFLWQFVDDFGGMSDDEAKYYYYEKFKRLIEIIYNVNENVSEGFLSITECNISNSVYNYRIGHDIENPFQGYEYTPGDEISLINLTKHLYRKGFSVSFHNWNSTHLKVSIPIIDDEASETSEESMETSATKNGNKIKAHRFTVHRKLSIKQTSPTNHQQAAEAREMFLSGLADFTP
jgi:hypothetical protein